tara:strand:- start:2186 stop:2896 length:711 start_codon:yes stop_codon:yes gene_type:complete
MKLLSNKKGFELSTNIIVILIISIVVFVGGIGFTTKFFGVAEERKASVDAETQAAIEQLLDTGAKVAIPLFRKQVKRGSGVTFGIGIRNVNAQSDQFHVIMSFDEAANSVGNRIENLNNVVTDYINEQWIATDVSIETIAPQERKVVPIFIRAQGTLCDSSFAECEDSSTPKGTYIFNVCVCNEDAAGQNPCAKLDGTSKLCIFDNTATGPATLSELDLYGKTNKGDVHKIIVEIV